MPEAHISLVCELRRLPKDEFFAHWGRFYIGTIALRDALLRVGATGVDYGPVEASLLQPENSPEQGDRSSKPPEFCHFIVTGVPFQDDAGIYRSRLIVSERFLSILQGFKIESCRIRDLANGTSVENDSIPFLCSFCQTEESMKLCAGLNVLICDLCVRKFLEEPASVSKSCDQLEARTECCFCQQLLPSNQCKGNGDYWICADDLNMARNLLEQSEA